MDQKEIKISGKVVYEGKVVTLKVDTVLCPNGNESKREIVTHNGGAAVLLVLDGKILLERQFRYAYNEIIYEIPAGKLEKNENPRSAAIRELEEETGYIAKNIIDLGSIYPSVGYTDEIIYLYKDLLSKKKSGVLSYINNGKIISKAVYIRFYEDNKIWINTDANSDLCLLLSDKIEMTLYIMDEENVCGMMLMGFGKIENDIKFITKAWSHELEDWYDGGMRSDDYKVICFTYCMIKVFNNAKEISIKMN